MTVAEQIDNYLFSQLQKIRLGQTIVPYSGGSYAFRTDAGRLVDRNQEYTEHPDDLPGLVLYGGKNSATCDGAEIGMEDHLQEIAIEGFIPSDKSGTEGDALRNDILAVLKEDPWFGGLIHELRDVSTDVATQVGDSVFTVVRASCSVFYSAPYGSE